MMNERSNEQLEALNNLLSIGSPTELRKSVEELYHAFLAEPNAILPSKKIALHYYFLIQFLNELEEVT